MTRFHRLMFSASLLAAPALAFAQDEAEELCSMGPTNRDILFSVGGTALVTIVAGLVLVQTLARSLAGGGYTQTSSNTAAFGLAAFLGGAVGAGVMAMGDCGVANMPGGISLAVGLLGLVGLMFALATGKS